MPAALLRGSSLQKTVGRLQKYRCSSTPLPCEDHTLHVTPLGSSLCLQASCTVSQYSPAAFLACLLNKRLFSEFGKPHGACRSPGIAMAATAVLQHWYKLEQMSFPTGVTHMPPPPPPIRVALQPQASRPDPAQSAAPQRLPSAHMPVFKLGSPRTAALQAPQRSVPGRLQSSSSYAPRTVFLKPSCSSADVH